MPRIAVCDELRSVAPRLAKAVEQERAEEMRGIKRCSCGWGWRIIGHEYEDGCIERLEWAKQIRDRRERLQASAA